MKYLLRTCVCMMMFLLTACTENHSFSLDEKRQIIVIHNLLHLRIESESSKSGEHQVFRVLKRKHDTKDIYILRLHDISPELSVSKTNEHGIYKEIQIIDLLPNRRYTIIHSGMGGRVRIQEYFRTDSIGNLRVDQTRKRKVGWREVIGTDSWGT